MTHLLQVPVSHQASEARFFTVEPGLRLLHLSAHRLGAI